MEQQPTTPDLQAWWDEQSFPAKAAYQLNENGDLVLLAGANAKEHAVASLTTENAESIFKILTDKYAEAENKLNELQAEWDSTEDKLKLTGKVERMKTYLLQAKAVGDMEKLLAEVQVWQNAINEITDQNYQAKLHLAELGESLAESNNWKITTQVYKDLAEKWKQIGYADKDRDDQLWNRLEEARNKFYERKRQNHDDQKADMMRNLDLKIELVDKAEHLAASEEWKKTSEAYKDLMEEWKKVGHTGNDRNEELWQRFITAKNVFFDKKKQHYDIIQQQQEGNYLLKAALLEKAEAMKESTNWTATAKAYEELMDEWKKIGRVPQAKGDELWEKLQAAKDHFFSGRRLHNDQMRVGLEDNYAQKAALLQRAEALRTSTQWRETTEEMNELLAEWKKIGPVPNKLSNPQWEQFIGARKDFFARKDAWHDQRKEKYEKTKVQREQNAVQMVQELRDEIKEDEERLADFKTGLLNITPGIKKEKELREHLENLVKETESRIVRRKEKLKNIENDTKPVGGQKPKEQKQGKPNGQRQQPADQTAEPAEKAEDTTAQPAGHAETTGGQAGDTAALQNDTAPAAEAMQPMASETATTENTIAEAEIPADDVAPATQQIAQPAATETPEEKAEDLVVPPHDAVPEVPAANENVETENADGSKETEPAVGDDNEAQLVTPAADEQAEDTHKQGEQE